jgi:hypothetical protein
MPMMMMMMMMMKRQGLILVLFNNVLLVSCGVGSSCLDFGLSSLSQCDHTFLL